MAKQQLDSRLTRAQGIIKELKEDNEGLVQEIEKHKQFQENCMVILESRNIVPATRRVFWRRKKRHKNARSRQR